MSDRRHSSGAFAGRSVLSASSDASDASDASTDVPTSLPSPQTLRRRAFAPLHRAFDDVLRPILDDGFVLAVSGGNDSRALLESFARWKHRHETRALVVSVDHQTHRESARFAEAVAARAHVLALSSEIIVLRAHRHDEATLRNARYACLASVARANGLGTVVTAHHVDDDVEGLMMSLLGGGGGKDGAAMSLVRDMGHGLRLVRPFLALSRDTLTTSLGGARVLAINLDAQDARGVGQRAHIRHHLLPPLNDVHPTLRDGLARHAGRRQHDEHALHELALSTIHAVDDGLVVDVTNHAVTRRAVMLAARRLTDVDPRGASATLDQLVDDAVTLRAARDESERAPSARTPPPNGSGRKKPAANGIVRRYALAGVEARLQGVKITLMRPCRSGV